MSSRRPRAARVKFSKVYTGQDIVKAISAISAIPIVHGIGEPKQIAGQCNAWKENNFRVYPNGDDEFVPTKKYKFIEVRQFEWLNRLEVSTRSRKRRAYAMKISRWLLCNAKGF